MEDIEFCQDHSGIKADIANLKKSDSDQWDHITNIEKALSKLVPIWVSIVLMVSSFITGCALTAAGMIMRFSGKV